MKKVTSSMSESFVILGAGGHASVLADSLLRQNKEIIAFVSPAPAHNPKAFQNARCLKSEQELLNEYDPREVYLANGIGPKPHSELNAELFEKLTKHGYYFPPIIDPLAHVSVHCKIQDGAQIMAGVIIQPFTKIGKNTLVNTGATIDHDCEIGSHNHIAPSATICGGVKTSAKVFVGAGATIIPNITIGSNAIIGAGTTIVKPVSKGAKLYTKNVFALKSSS